jgi:hypothetical protein
MITKVIAGGQTGVDRAALDAALAAGFPVGGWCPSGRRAEDGRIPDHYPLVETPTPEYAERTRRDVREAAATLILTWGEPTGGTALTLRTCQNDGKPFFLVNLHNSASTSADRVRSWQHPRCRGATCVPHPAPKAAPAPLPSVPQGAIVLSSQPRPNPAAKPAHVIAARTVLKCSFIHRRTLGLRVFTGMVKLPPRLNHSIVAACVISHNSRCVCLNVGS